MFKYDHVYFNFILLLFLNILYKLIMIVLILYI